MDVNEQLFLTPSPFLKPILLIGNQAVHFCPYSHSVVKYFVVNNLYFINT